MIPGSASDRKFAPARLLVKTIALPWECFLLPVSAFPLQDEEVSTAGTFLKDITSEVSARWQLASEVCVQVEQSDETEYRLLHAKHAAKWIPEVGLGVWPDREPPAVWTKEEFMNVAPGEKLRPMMYQVLRITTSQEARQQARDLMLKYGPALEIMTSDDSDTFLKKTTALLLPPIKDPSYTCFPFYVPLLEVKSLIGASPEQLEAWFCGASLYIRESFEDKGILIVSREPFGPILEKLGGRFEQKPEPHWEIPV
jgi:hypothetical protein